MMFLRPLPPAPWESPFSHLIRLTESNRESSPVRLLRQCQTYPRNNIIAGLINVPALAQANGSATQEFCKSFEAFRRQKRGMKMLSGVSVIAGGIRALKEASFCLQCAQSDGIIEVVWHIANFTCCPKHGVAQTVVCERCGKPASWNRPSPLRCGCGGGLIAKETRRATESEIVVCGIMRRAFIADAPLIDLKSMPIRELGNLPLADLLRVIRFFASHTTEVQRSQKGKVKSEVLANTPAGAAVFDEWPCNFRSALDTIERVRGRSIHVGDDRRNWICHMLGTARLKRPEFEFIRKEIQQRVTLTRRERMTVVSETPYFEIRTTTRLLGVDQRTLLRACRNGTVPCTPTKRNGIDGFVVDHQNITTSLLRAGTPMQYRDAARLLGLPVRLLKLAETSRLFTKTMRSYHFREGGWARQDIQNIRSKLDMVVTPKLASRAKVRNLVPLRSVLRESYLSLEYRYALLKRYLSGRLGAVRRGKGFSGVLVDDRLRTLEAQRSWAKLCRSAPHLPSELKAPANGAE